MAELKTKQNDASIEKFLGKLDEVQREDTKEIMQMMKEATGTEGKMWGTAIIGFGLDKLTYASGRELEWFRVGVSPRKTAISLYGLRTALDNTPDGEKKLGKFTSGKGCIYVKKLTDIDKTVLKKIIKDAATKSLYHTNFA